MARRRRPEKRIILPDPKYGDEVLSKFMNSVMLDGKKSVAELIVYGALETVEARAKKDPLWWADTVQRLDLDNARKVVTDALKEIAIVDDKQIHLIHAAKSWLDERDAQPYATITLWNGEDHR